MLRHRTACLFLVILSLVAAACGDDDAADPVSETATDAAGAAPETTTGTAEPEPDTVETAPEPETDTAEAAPIDTEAAGSESAAPAVVGDPDGEFCTTFNDGAIGGEDDLIDDAEVVEIQAAIDRLAESTPPELEVQMATFTEGTQLLLDETVAADGDIATAFEKIATEQPELFERVLAVQDEISDYCGG